MHEYELIFQTAGYAKRALEASMGYVLLAGLGIAAWRVGRHLSPRVRTIDLVGKLALLAIGVGLIVDLTREVPRGRCARALEEGDAKTVEGPVEACEPWRDGTGCSMVRIAGATFHAYEAGQACGGNSGALHDPRIRPGAVVRVEHRGLDILRMAVLRSVPQGPADSR